MATTYGVIPQGFARKPLDIILAEIEEKARGVFGDGVIQTPQSPLGQLNGLVASIIATTWEIAESSYQSYDPDQAEGIRLEMLGRIRLLERVTGETDVDYRQAITNAGRARIDLGDIDRALRNVDGVTYVKIFENNTAALDANGQDPKSLAICVIGGADEDVARVIRTYVAPGVATYGNTLTNFTVDGFCRSILFIRPVELRVGLEVTVTVANDRNGCPPPSTAAMAITLAAGLSGASRPANGEDITTHMVRTVLATAYPNVEVQSASARLLPATGLIPLPLPIGFFQIASIATADVNIEVAP